VVKEANNNNQQVVSKAPIKQISKKQKTEMYLQKVQQATFVAATNLKEAQRKCKTHSKLPIDTRSKIVAGADTAYELKPGSIKPKTVVSRFKRNNMEGIKPQQTSPLIEM
jgi:hypothetical protein